MKTSHFLFLFLCCLQFQCEAPKAVCTKEDISPNANSNVKNVSVINLTESDTGILVMTDSDLDGKKEDYLWVKADWKNKENSLFFFNEIQNSRQQTVEQIWFGPDNRKIIGKIDLNKDGKLETTVYYNSLAKPKVVSGIIARMEIDLNGDGKTEYWIFPGLRLEKDGNGDEIPDLFTEDKSEITKIFNSIEKNEKLSEKLSSLESKSSFVQNPSLIKNPTHQAVISGKY